jgi:hypothetical protein
MTRAPNSVHCRELTNKEIAGVAGGLSLQTTATIQKPIITAQMIANPDISGYFVPHINVVPNG